MDNKEKWGMLMIFAINFQNLGNKLSNKFKSNKTLRRYFWDGVEFYTENKQNENDTTEMLRKKFIMSLRKQIDDHFQKENTNVINFNDAIDSKPASKNRSTFLKIFLLCF